MLKQVHSYARENFLGMLSAGISQVSHTLANIQNLRQQTSECLDLLEDSGRNDFLFYEDIAENAGSAGRRRTLSTRWWPRFVPETGPLFCASSSKWSSACRLMPRAMLPALTWSSFPTYPF